MAQQSLFDGCNGDGDGGGPDFDGATYNPAFDRARLGRQFLGVYDVLAGGGWWTLREIEAVTGYPQASISARIRDLRKRKFGGYPVPRRRRGDPKDGIHEYRLNEE